MKRKYIYAAIIMLMMPVLAGAQALKGSYFLDNSMNRHRMNPAFTPRSDYFQLAGLGNLGVGVTSNLDIPTFYFPQDGELLPFLHKDVSLDRFSKALPQHLHFDAELGTSLLSFGFFTKQKSFWTFDIDLISMEDIDLSRDLFVFLKKGTGTAGEKYSLGGYNAYVSTSLRASLGYSRDIIKGLRAGVKARFIAPVMYLGMNLKDATLTTGTDKWTLSTEQYIHQVMRGMTPEGDIDVAKMFAEGVTCGWGYSFDLGVEYRYEMEGAFNGFNVSAAVTDLGQVFYAQDATHSYSSKGSVDWAGFQNVNLSNADFEAALNDLASKAEGLIDIKEMTSEGSLVKSSMPRVFAGIEVPFLWNKMSVGLLYSARFSHSYARQELTASYNLKPCSWFAMGVNWSFLNTTQTLGWILEFTPKVGPTLYVGCDYMPLSYAKAPLLDEIYGTEMLELVGLEEWYLPLAMRFNMNFGIAFTLGTKYGR